jgi:hypothetical protein
MRHAARCLPPLAGIGLLVGLAGAAHAMDACHGEFSASPLKPLPAPAVIGIDRHDNSDETTTLAAAFTRGMSSAGAQVAGAQAATVQLSLSWQVLNQGGGNGGQGAGNNPLVPMQPGPPGTGGQVWSGNSQTFLQGGIDRTLPSMPDSTVFSGGPPVQPGLLIVRAEARDPTGNTIYWIGSVQCALTGGENEALLYQLGQLIGGAIGQRREHTAI